MFKILTREGPYVIDSDGDNSLISPLVTPDHLFLVSTEDDGIPVDYHNELSDPYHCIGNLINGARMALEDIIQVGKMEIVNGIEIIDLAGIAYRIHDPTCRLLTTDDYDSLFKTGELYPSWDFRQNVEANSYLLFKIKDQYGEEINCLTDAPTEDHNRLIQRAIELLANSS